MNYYIKIVLGYRENQTHSVPANEAHKAYYLFENPKERGIFSNGLAIRGEDIKSIEPDYNATMGWPPNYRYDDFDWNHLVDSGVVEKMKYIMGSAKNIAVNEPQKLNIPLSKVLREKKSLELSSPI